MGASYAKSPFDIPEPGPRVGDVSSKLISPSHLYCLVQHVAEWSQYYCFVDCRSLAAYNKSHVVGAEHVDDIEIDRTNEVMVILYGKNDKAKPIKDFLEQMSTAASAPTAVYVLKGSLSKFKKRYRVAMSHFKPTRGEQPGPLELIPATRKNPAVYCIHRNQFQHCKTTIAYLGCSSVINLSSRRLFLKTAAIRLENIQFDSVSEPYDEAIAIFTRYMSERPRSATKGNILMIDETGCDYATLLIGWWWYKQGFDIEEICEQLTNKMGELDPWYLDVFRAWTESEQ